MPIHFSDVDVVSKAQGVRSALIVPCTMCPATTVASREGKPFMQLYRSLFTSPPFEQYLATLRSRLADQGIRTEVFKSRLYHHWFLCMWTAGRRERVRKRARKHDAVIVLGCESATETVREAAEGAGCRLIEGMEMSGIMNAQLKFRLSGSISFEACKIVPISGQPKQAKLALDEEEEGAAPYAEM